MKTFRLSAFILFAVLGLQSVISLRAGENENHRLHLGPVFRQDSFTWSIAGDQSGKNPNILSELEWKDIRSFGLRGGADGRFLEFFVLKAEANYGWITDGYNVDSDYEGNNRTRLFSRSTADTEGYLLDFEVSVGLDFFPRNSRAALVPKAGFSFNRQNFEDTNGYQQVDREFGETGPFSGLNSEYRADWTGGFAGLDLRWNVSETLKAKLDGRFTLADYSAEAVWNLRDDLRQSPSFEQSADGSGWSLVASLDWKFRTNWALEVYAGWKRWTTDSGTDTIFFADGKKAKTRFNEAEWESFKTGISVSYSF